jgi:hypothetical protein
MWWYYAAMAVLGAIQTALPIISGQKRASEQGQAINAQLATQEAQINAQAGEKMGQQARSAWAARSRAMVAAGEAGVTGNSVQAQLRDTLFQQGQNDAEIAYNAQQSKDTALGNAKGEAAGLTSASNLSGGILAIGSGINGYSNAKNNYEGSG